MESLPISQIRPNSENPRYIKDEKFKKLVQSIKEFPEMMPVRPIVVNKEMVVLGGNMRLKAMQEAGLDKVWVEVVDWSEEKQREFIIKDNVGFGEWDWDELANTWETEELNEWGLDTPDNWGGEELEAEEDDYQEPDSLQVDVILGDLIEIGEHRLLCGDSTDSDQVAKLMGGETFDLITDPPYGISANKQTLGAGKKDFHRGDNWDDKIPEFWQLLPFFQKCIVWGGNYFADKLELTNDWLCWHKKNDDRSFSEFELAWSNIGTNCRLLSHHWGGEEKQHPTMKPVKVMEWCINLAESKKIFDLFLGSGSTMVAAHQLKRKCYGMELDPKYCQVIIDRMTKLDPDLSVKINGKEYVKTTIEQ